jgi:tryptophan-rich hypothetical protein
MATPRRIIAVKSQACFDDCSILAPMIRLNPEKLHLSKWTATNPVRKDKHFIVTALIRDERETVVGCLMEAVHSRRLREIDWRELKDTAKWLQGWR